MRKLPAQYLAWFLWAVLLALFAVYILVVHFLVPSLQQAALVADIVFIVSLAALATTGAVVVSRYPGNPIGWLLLFATLAAAVAGGTEIYAQYTVHVRPGALPGGVVAALLPLPFWFVFFGQLTFVVLLFPGGTLLSARWRWVSWGLIGAVIANIASVSLAPELEYFQPPIRNPITIVGAGGILNAIETTALVAILLLLLAAAVSLVLRLIRSTGEERQQIKWFAYSAVLFGAHLPMLLLYEEVTGNAIPDSWDAVLFGGFLSLLPAGMAMAILKYRLYDIDLVINRTLVYGTLTALLGGFYFGSVIGLQATFRATTGQGGGEMAIVISTLAIAALFMPLRRRIQVLIERRFYRRRYDAALTLAAFADRMRDEVDVERLTGELVTVVEQTMQPTHVSLWLRSDPGGSQRDSR